MQLQEDKLIVQRWRFSSWADGQYSNVSEDFFLTLFICKICIP
jgi:activator of HSP90 ATPase